MLVVGDSSPLIVLVNIGHVDVLPKLFGQVFVPPAVTNELAFSSRPQAVRDFGAVPPAWLHVQRATAIQPIPELHPGETEALSLALELHADKMTFRSPTQSPTSGLEGRMAESDRSLD